MNNKDINILVVDDERKIVDLVEAYLKNENYNIFKYYTGMDALNCIHSSKIDLALLDVMLPDIDGFQLCRTIREKEYFPIIMLTGKAEDVDKITGLAFGADDYITKPFNLLELVARVKTQLRRYLQYNNSGDFIGDKEYDVKGLVINKSTHTCSLFGKTVRLTPIEFSILWYLCENRGRVVSSEKLFETIWGESYLESNNTVMAHIGRIREKLNENSKNPRFIKTVWGVGYFIE